MSSVFRDVLGGIHRRVEGSRAVSLIGLDGIAVDSVGDGTVPLETLGAEFGAFVRSLRLSDSDLDTGEVEQFVLVTRNYTTFLSSVNREYFILLVLAPGGNYGRARFELRKAKAVLDPELS